MAIIQNIFIVLAALASLAAVLYRPVTLRVEVLGLNRPASAIQNVHGEDFQLISDTLYCEDLHHHLPSGLLFSASEEKAETRRQWFPPYVMLAFLFCGRSEIPPFEIIPLVIML